MIDTGSANVTVATGAAVAGTLGTITPPVALPVVAGAAASIAVGIGVSSVAKRVRRGVAAARAAELSD